MHFRKRIIVFIIFLKDLTMRWLSFKNETDSETRSLGKTFKCIADTQTMELSFCYESKLKLLFSVLKIQLAFCQYLWCLWPKWYCHDKTAVKNWLENICIGILFIYDTNRNKYVCMTLKASTLSLIGKETHSVWFFICVWLIKSHTVLFLHSDTDSWNTKWSMQVECFIQSDLLYSTFLTYPIFKQ